MTPADPGAPSARRRRRYGLLRLRSSETEAEPVSGINIIPVIDISLVLLVILFVTAPLLSVPNIPVVLPRSSQPQSAQATIPVTLTRDGELSLRAQPLAWGELDAALASEVGRRPSTPVVLRVDQAVPYRLVARLLAAAKKAGAREIAFGTTPPR